MAYRWQNIREDLNASLNLRCGNQARDLSFGDKGKGMGKGDSRAAGNTACGARDTG